MFTVAWGHMVIGSGGKEAVPPWIFIYGTVKVKGGLIVLFFGLVYSVYPPRNFSADALVIFCPKYVSFAHTLCSLHSLFLPFFCSFLHFTIFSHESCIRIILLK